MSAHRAASVGLLAAAALSAPIVSGQDVLVVAPKAVAGEFLNAVTVGDWPTVVRLTDDQSLWEYVTALRTSMHAMGDVPAYRPTVDELMQQDSLMPRVVAEYMVRQRERDGRFALPMLTLRFADVERVSQLDSLTDAELFVRLLRAKQVSYQFSVWNKTTGCATPATVLPEPVRTVRGVAMLSATEAVALYDERGGIFGNSPVRPTLQQLTLRRTQLGWRVVASEELLSGGSMAFGFSSDGCSGGK